MLHFGQEHGGLQRVQAAVGTDFLVVVLLGAAVGAQQPQPRGEFAVVGDRHAAVAPAAEVLAGEKGKCARPAQLTCHAPLPTNLPPGADRLGGVLYDPQVVPFGHRLQSLHGRHLAEQVDRNDCTGSGCDRGFDGVGVDVEGIRIDIDEHRLASGVGDGAGGGKERERGGDDFVAGRQLECLERKQQRVGAAGTCYAVLGRRERGDCLFQLADLFAHDEPLALDHFENGRHGLLFDRLKLSLQVQQRYRHISSKCKWDKNLSRPAGEVNRPGAALSLRGSRNRSGHTGPGRPQGSVVHRSDTSNPRDVPALPP